ncbi:MAG: ABC transporter ATP-binding protein [Verrucomicrobia bacterium]|nr:ABC transporter ATP-binding protein [Cytophagales bacterium]
MNPYLSLLKTAWGYAKQEKKKFLLTYLLFVLANIATAANPLLWGWFVDVVQKKDIKVLDMAWWYGGAYLALKLLEWAFHGPARILERQLAFNLSRNFLDEMYHQTLHLPAKWHQDHHSGATINRIRKAYQALKDFFDSGFMYVHAFLKFIFSLVAMVYFSPLFGSIGIAIGIFTVFVIFIFDKPFIKTLEETNEREHILSSTLFDSLSNIITVITLRLEKRMETSLQQKIAAILPPFRKSIRINEWKWFVADTLVTIIYVVVTVGYVYQNWVPGQIFPLGGLVTLLGFVIQFTSVFHDVALQYTEIVQHHTNVQTARSISEAYAERNRTETHANLPENWQSIDIAQLNFSYQEKYDVGKKSQSLHNLHLHIRRGKRIALIGESGSGKSTVLALLRGLYQAESGATLQADGKNIDWNAVANRVILFPQEPEIFENTIAYNITLGLPFSEKEVMEVCQTAHFKEVVNMLPNGLESNIQEKGVNLSGGQKQRLALARGVLAARSSDIVLLDEPTSSVDAKTEVQIYDRLFAEFADKAVVSSLHRLHLLTKFDYVYVLSKGEIIDEGTFEYLRENSEIFQDLWKHQEQQTVDSFQ